MLAALGGVADPAAPGLMREDRVSIAIYAGTFDPLTTGHVDVARRAARQFERLVVAVSSERGAKQPLFTAEERVAMARAVFADVPNIFVDSYPGLTVDYARRIGAAVMVRGLRTVSDFEYEFALAHMNGTMAPEIETVIFATSPQHAFISSSLVKQVALLGGDVAGMVPVQVEEALRQRRAVRA